MQLWAIGQRLGRLAARHSRSSNPNYIFRFMCALTPNWHWSLRSQSDWAPTSLPQWAKDVLVIDCETTIGLDQKLNFGFWRWCKLQPDGHYACLEEGIFYRNDLDNNAIKLLREFARTHKADVAPGNSTKMLIMSRDEFVNGPLWDIIMAGGVWQATTCVSISRGWLTAINPLERRMVVHHVHLPQAAKVRPDKYRPRITITPMDSHRAFFRLTGGRPRNRTGNPFRAAGRFPRAGSWTSLTWSSLCATGTSASRPPARNMR